MSEAKSSLLFTDSSYYFSCQNSKKQSFKIPLLNKYEGNNRSSMDN